MVNPLLISIFFITGTSGAGKTTLMHELKSILPSDQFSIHDVDENGVPSNADTDWRIFITQFWLEKAIENYKQRKTTVICGVTVPSEIIDCIKNNTLPINPYFGFIKVDDSIIEERLKQRGWNKQLIKDNINWAHYLENQVKKQENNFIINASLLKPAEVAIKSAQWIINIQRHYSTESE